MVEIDELEKRLDWLDSERQKDKKTISEMKDSLEILQGTIQRQNSEIKKLEIAVKANTQLSGRIETIGEEISLSKAELLKKLMDIEKSMIAGDKKVEKAKKEEFDALVNKVTDLQLELKPINDFKKTVQARIEEEFRINQKIETISSELPAFRVTDEELERQISLSQGERNQESKRVTDLQLENSAIKKRLEEIRNKYDIDKDLIHKVEKKIDDLIANEKERKQTQTAFIEKVSLDQLEKTSLWKTWQQQIDEFKTLGSLVTGKLLELDEAIRGIKKTQSEFDEINDRINRRINEITEMNRLAEDRFRGEWVAFKADDQKRWTNYTLTREEELREDSRSLNQVNNRLLKTEDSIQDIQDMVSLLTDELKKMVNGLYGTSQDMVESFTQTFKKRL
jgi:chromosome segregation ATPase